MNAAQQALLAAINATAMDADMRRIMANAIAANVPFDACLINNFDSLPPAEKAVKITERVNDTVQDLGFAAGEKLLKSGESISVALTRQVSQTIITQGFSIEAAFAGYFNKQPVQGYVVRATGEVVYTTIVQSTTTHIPVGAYLTKCSEVLGRAALGVSLLPTVKAAWDASFNNGDQWAPFKKGVEVSGAALAATLVAGLLVGSTSVATVIAAPVVVGALVAFVIDDAFDGFSTSMNLAREAGQTFDQFWSVTQAQLEQNFQNVLNATGPAATTILNEVTPFVQSFSDAVHELSADAVTGIIHLQDKLQSTLYDMIHDPATFGDHLNPNAGLGCTITIDRDPTSADHVNVYFNRDGAPAPQQQQNLNTNGMTIGGAQAVVGGPLRLALRPGVASDATGLLNVPVAVLNDLGALFRKNGTETQAAYEGLLISGRNNADDTRIYRDTLTGAADNLVQLGEDLTANGATYAEGHAFVRDALAWWGGTGSGGRAVYLHLLQGGPSGPYSDGANVAAIERGYASLIAGLGGLASGYGGTAGQAAVTYADLTALADELFAAAVGAQTISSFYNIVTAGGVKPAPGSAGDKFGITFAATITAAQDLLRALGNTPDGGAGIVSPGQSAAAALAGLVKGHITSLALQSYGSGPEVFAHIIAMNTAIGNNSGNAPLLLAANDDKRQVVANAMVNAA